MSDESMQDDRHDAGMPQEDRPATMVTVASATMSFCERFVTFSSSPSSCGTLHETTRPPDGAAH